MNPMDGIWMTMIFLDDKDTEDSHIVDIISLENIFTINRHTRVFNLTSWNMMYCFWDILYGVYLSYPDFYKLKDNFMVQDDLVGYVVDMVQTCLQQMEISKIEKQL